MYRRGLLCHLVACHGRVGVAVLCKPVRHKQVGLLQLDQDPLDCSRCEDPRYNLRRVAAGRSACHALATCNLCIIVMASKMPMVLALVCFSQHRS